MASLPAVMQAIVCSRLPLLVAEVLLGAAPLAVDMGVLVEDYKAGKARQLLQQSPP